MKKALLLIYLITIASHVAIAQQPRTTELNVSIGRLTGYDLFYPIANGFMSYGYQSEIKAAPVFAFHFSRRADDDHNAHGVSVSYHVMRNSDTDFRANYSSKQTHKIFTICYESRIAYRSGKYFLLYGTAAIGALVDLNSLDAIKKGGFSTEDLFFALYLSPLGLRVGKKQAFFTEVGYGYKGLVSAGYSCRLGRRKKDSVNREENNPESKADQDKK